MGGVIIFTSPFWHIDFPRKTDHIKQFESKLAIGELKLEKEIELLRQQYENNVLTAEEYILSSEARQKELAALVKKNGEILKTEIDKNRIFVWKNPRAFLLGLGVRLPYVFFAIILSILISLINTNDIYLKRAFFLFQSFSYGIATYLMIWVFWTSQDFSLSAYRYAFIGTSLLVGTSLSYFLIWKRHKVARLEGIIRNLFDFIVFESKDKGFIKDERKPEYEKREEELVFDALDNE
ncbi:hypothetical protein FGF1_03890 [Flavobacteriaceae bacterium GF1]